MWVGSGSTRKTMKHGPGCAIRVRQTRFQIKDIVDHVSCRNPGGTRQTVRSDSLFGSVHHDIAITYRGMASSPQWLWASRNGNLRDR